MSTRMKHAQYRAQPIAVDRGRPSLHVRGVGWQMRRFQGLLDCAASHTRTRASLQDQRLPTLAPRDWRYSSARLPMLGGLSGIRRSPAHTTTTSLSGRFVTISPARMTQMFSAVSLHFGRLKILSACTQHCCHGGSFMRFTGLCSFVLHG